MELIENNFVLMILLNILELNFFCMILTGLFFKISFSKDGRLTHFTNAYRLHDHQIVRLFPFTLMFHTFFLVWFFSRNILCVN